MLLRHRAIRKPRLFCRSFLPETIAYATHAKQFPIFEIRVSLSKNRGSNRGVCCAVTGLSPDSDGDYRNLHHDIYAAVSPYRGL